jgi:hypothetical protein
MKLTTELTILHVEDDPQLAKLVQVAFAVSGSGVKCSGQAGERGA